MESTTQTTTTQVVIPLQKACFGKKPSFLFTKKSYSLKKHLLRIGQLSISMFLKTIYPTFNKM
jgi:hypothetical protein